MRRRTFMEAVLGATCLPYLPMTVAPKPPAIPAPKNESHTVVTLIDLRNPCGMVQIIEVPKSSTVGDVIKKGMAAREPSRDDNNKILIRKNRQDAYPNCSVEMNDLILVVSCKLRGCGPSDG